jgi:ABC-type spermidine/putrescine transport system permease subunit II
MSARRGLRVVLRALYVSVLAATVVFMLAPSVVVLLLSFSNDAFMRLPPTAWGFRQYATLFSNGEWLTPLVRSITLAAWTAVIAVPVGLAAVLGLYRTAAPGRSFVQFLGLAPLLVPSIAYAVALYSLLAQARLLGRFEGLLAVHITLALPYVLLITGAAITRVPRELEMAALSLGATRPRAWLDITLRLLLPAIVASWIFAFIGSFDETIITSFLAASGFVTLPVAIFSNVRYGVDPVITAIATLLTAGTALLLAANSLLRRSR